jgi:Mn2+/Fe2+ NRAMP family transporter
LIIAGSIVGSGELIGTTITGAVAGFWLMWLIVIGCVIKVFVQVELGRYTIASGQTAIGGLNDVPGPTIELTGIGRRAGRTLRVNWLVWYWLAMFLVSLGQLGGIVGGVGQALAISVPLTEAGRRANTIQEIEVQFRVATARLAAEDFPSAGHSSAASLGADGASVAARRQRLEAAIDEHRAALARLGPPPAEVHDTALWAAAVTAVTALLLMIGRYKLIEVVSTFLVAGFTLVTLFNVVALQFRADWAVSWEEVINGLSFRLPPERSEARLSPLATALATFGIIGVGANELIAYPYFCLEKGYARFVGPRQGDEAWAERARGWLRVMRWDAGCSMVVYTFATLAFYLCGAAILGRIAMVPDNRDLVRTLTVMYEPVFGAAAPVLFLFGAFAVLFSTFFVANAGHARTVADALAVVGLASGAPRVRRRWVVAFSGLFPLVALGIYLWLGDPIGLVLASGVMQAIMLPMLSGAALWFRYRRTDVRLAPGRWWDLWLWLSAAGMFVAGGYLALSKLFPSLERWL